MREYKWSSFRDIPTIRQRAMRAAMQFTPANWTRVRWEPTKSIKRFLCLHALFWVVQGQELNAFYLKQLLWIPPESNLNIYRILIWYFLGLPALRQAFFYVTDTSVKRLGMHAWLGIFMMSTELILIFKLASPFSEEFTKPMPLFPKIGFIASIIAYILFTVNTCVTIRRADRRGSVEVHAEHKED